MGVEYLEGHTGVSPEDHEEHSRTENPAEKETGTRGTALWEGTRTLAVTVQRGCEGSWPAAAGHPRPAVQAPGEVLGDGASVCRGQGLPRVSAGTVCTDFTWALVWSVAYSAVGSRVMCGGR